MRCRSTFSILSPTTDHALPPRIEPGLVNLELLHGWQETHWPEANDCHRPLGSCVCACFSGDGGNDSLVSSLVRLLGCMFGIGTMMLGVGQARADSGRKRTKSSASCNVAGSFTIHNQCPFDCAILATLVPICLISHSLFCGVNRM